MEKSIGDQAVEKVESNRSEIGLTNKDGSTVEKTTVEKTTEHQPTSPPPVREGSNPDAARESAEAAGTQTV